MPTAIMGPLASKLFDLGQVQQGGPQTANYTAPMQTLQDGIKSTAGGGAAPRDNSGERAQAIANVAGMAAQAYAGSQSGVTPPDEKGNGFGLGGTLTSNPTNEIGSTEYAGTQKATLGGLFTSPNEPTAIKDNGYRDSNPYAANYGEAEKPKPSLFTYGGSYGGATY